MFICPIVSMSRPTLDAERNRTPLDLEARPVRLLRRSNASVVEASLRPVIVGLYHRSVRSFGLHWVQTKNTLSDGDLFLPFLSLFVEISFFAKKTRKIFTSVPFFILLPSTTFEPCEQREQPPSTTYSVDVFCLYPNKRRRTKRIKKKYHNFSKMYGQFASSFGSPPRTRFENH